MNRRREEFSGELAGQQDLGQPDTPLRANTLRINRDVPRQQESRIRIGGCAEETPPVAGGRAGGGGRGKGGAALGGISEERLVAPIQSSLSSISIQFLSPTSLVGAVERKPSQPRKEPAAEERTNIFLAMKNVRNNFLACLK